MPFTTTGDANQSHALSPASSSLLSIASSLALSLTDPAVSPLSPPAELRLPSISFSFSSQAIFRITVDHIVMRDVSTPADDWACAAMEVGAGVSVSTGGLDRKERLIVVWEQRNDG